MTPVSVTVGPGVVTATLVLATTALSRAAVLTGRRAGVAGRLPATAIGPSTGSPGAISGWSRPPARLLAALTACAVPITVGRAWSGWLVGTGLALTIGWFSYGPGAAATAALVAVGGPVLAWRLLRHRADAKAEAELPMVMDAVAGGLRSGGSLRQALAEAARGNAAAGGVLADDLADVVKATDHGATVVGALERWGARRPLPGVRLAVAALCLGAETGGAGARAVEGVAATLRSRLAALAEARALATQARASAVVIAVAPVAFAVLASATDDRTARFLLGSPVGLSMLVTGLTLDALGALWMARLTRVPV